MRAAVGIGVFQTRHDAIRTPDDCGDLLLRELAPEAGLPIGYVVADLTVTWSSPVRPAGPVSSRVSSARFSFCSGASQVILNSGVSSSCRRSCSMEATLACSVACFLV